MATKYKKSKTKSRISKKSRISRISRTSKSKSRTKSKKGNKDVKEDIIKYKLNFQNDNPLQFYIIVSKTHVVILDYSLQRFIHAYPYKKVYYNPDSVDVINKYGKNLLYQMPDGFNYLSNIYHKAIFNKNGSLGIKESKKKDTLNIHWIKDYKYLDDIESLSYKQKVKDYIKKNTEKQLIYIGLDETNNTNSNMKKFLKNIDK
jgi:hypothetical protein